MRRNFEETGIRNLRIQTGSADGGRKAKAGLHQIDAHRPTGQLGIQIQKLFLCTKGAQKIVAAAKGQTAHGCICIAIDPGERFVEGAVAAGSEYSQFFPALPGLLRSGIGQLPGMTGVICDLNGIFFRRKPCTRGGNIDLLRQRTGAIGLGFKRNNVRMDFLLQFCCFYDNRKPKGCKSQSHNVPAPYAQKRSGWLRSPLQTKKYRPGSCNSGRSF